MNRRDFLQPRRLARTAGKMLGVLEELRDLDAAVRPHLAEVALVRYGRRAMATTFEIMLPFGTPSSPQAAEEALDEIDRLEAQLTVYRDDSEVSLLNQQAARGPVQVDEGLFDLLQLAARINRDTLGAFDISVGALLKTWGIYRRCQQVPTEADRAEALERGGMRHVVLDSETGSVHFLRPGLEINLGSIGKGYALDRAANLVRSRWGLASALLHGGHSSIYALGGCPGEERGWPVGVRHPWDPERRLALVRLRDRALGTSAATFQHLEYNGRKLGHILDPRTGWPATGMASASVLAPTAGEADALATAFFILGPEPAQTYCAGRPEIGAILLPEAGRPVVLGTAAQEVDFIATGD